MPYKPAIRRAIAQQDIDDAVSHYFEENGDGPALRFLDALEAAIYRIQEFPGIGSPRYGELLNLSTLRFYPVQHFPYLIFYIERQDQVDVWRVLHSRRDLPKWLQAEYKI